MRVSQYRGITQIKKTKQTHKSGQTADNKNVIMNPDIHAPHSSSLFTVYLLLLLLHFIIKGKKNNTTKVVLICILVSLYYYEYIIYNIRIGKKFECDWSGVHIL